MKKILKKLIGEKLLGYYDFVKHPEYKQSWGGAFNGQTFRQKMFQQIINSFNIDIIVETGTYRGTTTDFMSNNFSKEILTVESNKRFFGYSKLRFLFNNKIKLNHSDSRKFLNEILDKHNSSSKYIFFYLDAHWEEDLPLIEELEIIFTKCIHPIVMIDDFKVPDDDGYQYDDYGYNKSLTIELLSQLNNFNLWYFFPSQDSKLETGAKRGSIVLTNSEDIKEILSNLDSLRMFNLASNCQ